MNARARSSITSLALVLVDDAGAERVGHAEVHTIGRRELELNDGSPTPGALAGVDQCGAATFPGTPGPACLFEARGDVLQCK